VVLTNNGSAPLTVSGIALGGDNPGDFAVLTAPTAVAAGGSLEIQVTFTPQALGARAATVVVTDNHLNAPNSRQTVALSGTGTPGTAIVAAQGTTPQSTGEGQPFSIPLQVTVTDSNGVGVADASVTFTAPSSGASGTFAGGGTTFSTTTGPDGTATAPVFTANSVAGSYDVTATSDKLSTAFHLTNLAPDFSVTAAPTSLTLGQGETGQVVFTVTPLNGYNQPVQFSINGLPAGVTATFSPPSVTPNGAPVISTLTIVNAATTAAGAPLLALGGLFLALALRRRDRRLAALVVGLGLLGLLGGCGGSQTSGNYSTPAAPTSSATTSTVPVTVTVSSGDGTTAHAVAVNVTLIR
jgi:hypothetical protein